MGTFKKIKFAVAYTMWFIWTFSTNVYATAGTSDAVSDIMNSDRFQGAISSIQWLTQFIDKWFTMAISLTAFFIISSALLKNACAAAYVANHKFWDSVAEAHEKSATMSISGVKDFFAGGGVMQANVGTVKTMLFSIVPNVKALTDFDDADIEPKAYFAKAIPQMIVCVIIGVFIYNGYYRDMASVVGNFGSEICNRVFASVDPASFLNKLTDTTKTPDNIYANDTTLQGKDAYEISMAMYKTVLSNAKGLSTSEAKESLMRDCEKYAYDLVSNATFQSTFYGDSRKYDFSAGSIKVTVVNSIPNGYSSTIDHPVVQAVDGSTDDKWTVSAYASVPNTAKEYITSNNGYICLSCVMSGTSKDVTKKGTTNMQATAGTWNASTIDLGVINVRGYVSSDQGGARLYSTDNVQIATLISTSSLENAVVQYCTDSSMKYVPGSISVEAYSGYNAGSGQRPCIKFNNATAGSTINVTISVAYKATGVTDNGDAGTATLYNLKINVNFQLTE